MEKEISTTAISSPRIDEIWCLEGQLDRAEKDVIHCFDA